MHVPVFDKNGKIVNYHTFRNPLCYQFSSLSVWLDLAEILAKHPSVVWEMGKHGNSSSFTCVNSGNGPRYLHTDMFIEWNSQLKIAFLTINMSQPSMPTLWGAWQSVMSKCFSPDTVYHMRLFAFDSMTCLVPELNERLTS